MNDNATVLFSAFDDGIGFYTRDTASRIRKILSAQTLSVEQHQELEAALQSQLRSFTWFLLGRFDNVGCSLPDGVVGYSIIAHPRDLAKPDEYEVLPNADIREGEEDYADMWQDYLADKIASATMEDQSQ